MSIKEWAPVVSATAAAIASVGSWYSIYTQGKRDKRNKEPIVAPGIKNIETTISSILSDWDDEQQLNDKFSKTKIPIWNYGSTPVFNIKYFYEIENFNEFWEKGEFEPRISNDYHFALIAEKDYQSLSMTYTKEHKGKGFYNTKFLPFTRHLDAIQPNKYSEIFLPDYFIILLNHYFLNTMLFENINPILKLTIHYDDINFKSWRKEFRIFIPGTYNLSGGKLKTSFHYEIAMKKKKIKRLTAKQNEKRFQRATKIARLKSFFKKKEKQDKKEEQQL